MITIGIIEHSTLLSKAYRKGFEEAERFDVLFCGTMEELHGAHATAEPAVVLLEVHNGRTVPTLQQLEVRYPQSKVLLIADESRDEAIRDALAHGVQGFLTADVPFDELAVAVRRFHEGHPVLAAPVLKKILETFIRKPQREAGDAAFTPRENAIARCLCRGLTYKQIGQELHLSVYTVNQHLKKMYLKKGVNSRHELASLMLREERGSVYEWRGRM